MGLKWGNALECTEAVPQRVTWQTVHTLSECASLFWNKTCITEITPSSHTQIHTTILMLNFFYKGRGRGRQKQPIQTHIHVKVKIILIAGVSNLVLKVVLWDVELSSWYIGTNIPKEPIKLHSILSQQTIILILIITRTSNLSEYVLKKLYSIKCLEKCMFGFNYAGLYCIGLHTCSVWGCQLE